MKKMKKRILAGILVTAMILACVPVSKAKAEDTHENHCLCQCGGDAESCHSGTAGHTTVTEWVELTGTKNANGELSGLGDLATNKNYYLTCDVIVTSNKYWTTSNANVVLCLNGHNITFTSTAARLFLVNRGITLSITDCKGTGIISATSDSADGYIASIGANATFNLYGGTLTGSKTNAGSSQGGAVLVNDATFNMYGGAISDNESDVGAAVGIRRTGVFNLYRGTISGNTCTKSGAAVYMCSANANEKPTFNMRGGTISGNTSSQNGGGVYMSASATGATPTFNMHGGTISGNTSSVYGGGVYVSSTIVNDTPTFNMHGGEIKENTSNQCGGGVFLHSSVNNTPTFNMYDGIISGNKATMYYGGGIGLLCEPVSNVRVGTPTVNSEGGSIISNTCATYGAGIGAQTASPVKISVSGDANITGNKVGQNDRNIQVTSVMDVSIKNLDNNARVGLYHYNHTLTGNNENKTSHLEFATTDASGIPEGTVTCDYGYWETEVNTDTSKVYFLFSGAQVKGHSITLSGDIGVNFYLARLSNIAVLQNATAYLVFGGQTVETKACSGLAYPSTTIGSETYNCTVFSYPVSARQMDEDVTLILKDSSGVEFYRDTYCVNDYKEEASESGDANLITLTENMANYGAFANFHFDGEGQGGNTTGFDEITKDTFAPYKITQGTNMPEGITFYGLSLLTKSKTTLRVYFKLADATKINNYTFTYGDVNNQTLTLVDETNYAYFDIAGITAMDLDDMYDIKCGDVNVVTCGALSYAYMYLSGNNPDVNVANVLKSLYQYHVAAKAYAAAHSN